jgi:hypothetical protein
MERAGRQYRPKKQEGGGMRLHNIMLDIHFFLFVYFTALAKKNQKNKKEFGFVFSSSCC